jgi:hypothetical protein
MNHQPLIAPIRSARVQNFRGIRDLTLELHPKVTVLFGANAAGKTSILDAIAIGLGVIGSRVPKAIGRTFGKSGDIRVPWKDRPEIGEKRGVERPYARVEAACANGLRWDVTRYRARQDRRSAPSSVGTRKLFAVLDPLVRQALDRGVGAADGLPAPIPLVAAYGTERAVVDVPLRKRGLQEEFSRLGGLDQSLRATTRFNMQVAFPNAQFILTTHSEQVIASVEASSVRKLVAESEAA